MRTLSGSSDRSKRNVSTGWFWWERHFRRAIAESVAHDTIANGITRVSTLSWSRERWLATRLAMFSDARDWADCRTITRAPIGENFCLWKQSIALKEVDFDQWHAILPIGRSAARLGSRSEAYEICKGELRGLPKVDWLVVFASAAFDLRRLSPWWRRRHDHRRPYCRQYL
jgi:hypothetical protein